MTSLVGCDYVSDARTMCMRHRESNRNLKERRREQKNEGGSKRDGKSNRKKGEREEWGEKEGNRKRERKMRQMD